MDHFKLKNLTSQLEYLFELKEIRGVGENSTAEKL